MNFRSLVHHLIHNERGKISKHDVHDRAHARHGRANRDTGESRFRDRCVQNALGSELFDKTGGDLEYSAGFGNVFTADEDFRIAAHFFRHRLADGVT